ncbi:CPBP family intramembrane glutamic endopeptidase [Staphylococcus aureus]|uniref:CPBP family intramembrane glutamic endopeptidase n=1 Tax=Staphylococcus aureus TaxID=1280 RepID=UPI00406BCEDA
MLEKELELKKRWLIPLLILYILIVLKFTLSIQFGAFDYLFLPFLGILTLYCQFGRQGVKLLFKRPKSNMFLWTPLIVFMCVLIGAVTVLIGRSLGITNLAANGGVEKIFNNHDLFSKVIFFLFAWIHLIGEELITAAVCLPFLIILLKIFPKKVAIMIAVLLSSLTFGAIHLPTYDWNIYQSLIVISTIRLPFTFMWFKSRSILGGAIPHIVLDYIIIIATLLTKFY